MYKKLAEKIQNVAEYVDSDWSQIGSSYNDKIRYGAEIFCHDKAEGALVILLLVTAWNDSLEWAKIVKGE